jgi:hypothetical protein
MLIKSQERLTKGGLYDTTLFNLPAKPQYLLNDIKREQLPLPFLTLPLLLASHEQYSRLMFSAQFEHSQTKLRKTFPERVESFDTFRVAIDIHLRCTRQMVNDQKEHLTPL